MVTSFTDDFKVEWKDTADAGKTWLFDGMHFPKQLLPLMGELLDRVYEKFMDARSVLVNGYSFNTMPTPRPPTPEILRRGALDVWMNEYMPRIKQTCHRWRESNYEGMSLPELGREVRRLAGEAVDTFGYTMVVITGFMGPTFGFVHLLQEELGEDGPRTAATLLQGFENETAAAGAGLSELAELAAGLPAVAATLRHGRYENLESVEGGARFTAALQQYLDEFGWRVESWGEPEVPTWKENPRLPLMLIGRYLSDPDRSPLASITRAVEQREAAMREVESRLAPGKLEEFRALLGTAQAHVPVSEGRALWQLIIIGSLRVPFLALGRKLVAAGALDEANDVFYSTTAELEDAARDPSPAVRATVARRKVEYARWARLRPPPFVGSPPDLSSAPPEMQALAHLFFGAAPPIVEGATIKGQAASQGVVRGRARIIHSLSEAELLQHGEILVCTTTAPPWTPLFAIAGGVVTDTGGVLSHSAICAREYAIPCVVATQVATHMIPDGAMITVDGTKGVVTIEG